MGSHRYGAAALMARKSEFWCLAQAPVQPSAYFGERDRSFRLKVTGHFGAT
jgi:hypothetical protein